VSDIEAPADPKGTLGYRAAKLAVIVLSALIILALIGLVVGGILKLSGHPKAVAGGGAASTVFTLPLGAKILSKDVQPGRLILQVRGPDGDEIDIVSTDDGHLIARIKASAAPARP
jgi:hypothetical protein